MKVSFTILLCVLLSFSAWAQADEETVLYVIDSIPIIDEPEEGFDSLNEEDIQELTVVTSKAEIEKYGIKDLDKVMLITTKEYASRPTELKQIPSTKIMERVNGKWQYKNTTTPYTGPFIDYFLTGKKQGEGYLKNGLVESIRTVYYLDGKKHFERNFSNGVENGESKQYFPNGQLKYQGVLRNGKEEGVWEEWYSTSKLKRKIAYQAGKALPTKEQEKFHSLLTKAGQQFRGGNSNYHGAINTLDKAIELNPEYSDAYYERATAYFHDLKFEEAIKDYNKALVLEPLYMKALSNRAFARIRKFEFQNSRTLSKTKGVTVMASQDKVEILKEELEQICSDLTRAIELGDRKPMILDAFSTYCK